METTADAKKNGLLASDTTISVLVPAAGCGARAGLNSNKVLAPLLGRPLLWWTLSSLAAQLVFPSNGSQANTIEFVLAVREDERATVQQIYDSLHLPLPLRLVAGGATRADSVFNAVEAAQGDFVLVHDAARPCLSQTGLARVVEAALEHGAAILAIPASDTIKQITAGTSTAETPMIEATLDRSLIYLAQTPQIFRRNWLYNGLRLARQHNFVGTDCASYVERWLLTPPAVEEVKMLVGEAPLGVHIARGESSNLKVTFAEDLPRAEDWLRAHHGELVDKPATQKE